MLDTLLKVYTNVSTDMKLPSKTGQPSTDPVPTRFFEKEAAFLTEAQGKTGLPISELIRRSVRLMKRQTEVCGSYSFVIELSS